MEMDVCLCKNMADIRLPLHNLVIYNHARIYAPGRTGRTHRSAPSTDPVICSGTDRSRRKDGYPALYPEFTLWNFMPHCLEIFCTTVLPDKALANREPMEVTHWPVK